MTENDARATQRPPAAGPEPGADDASTQAPAEAQAESLADAAPARRRGRGWMFLPVLLILLAAGGYFGYNYLQDQARYVSTENALVTGPLLQVGTLNAGRVVSVAADIGENVARDQVVAKVALPSMVASTLSGSQKIGFRDTEDQAALVQSPVNGVVIARLANPGDTVAAGQPILTVVDPGSLWVQANIEETKIGRIHPGQPVEVRVDTLGEALPGRVAAVNTATAGTFSLMPQSNTTGNFTKVTQLVPVKIVLPPIQTPLVLGSSVEVKIQVQD
jgi:multidrug resistance efflux pump